jgi:hypothetical protein
MPSSGLQKVSFSKARKRTPVKKLNELFEFRYGHSLEFNRLVAASPVTGIPFVSRQRKRNGIAGYVQPIPGVKPNEPGELTCALSGQGGVMATHLQERPYYTAFHVACLRPKAPMSRGQLLYYCACLWANHYRYSWGRQANRTIRDILLPGLDEIPEWVAEDTVDERFRERLSELALLSESPPMPGPSCVGAERVRIRDLFKLTYGHSLELNSLTQSPDGVNYVSRTRENNGVSALTAC